MISDDEVRKEIKNIIIKKKKYINILLNGVWTTLAGGILVLIIYIIDKKRGDMGDTLEMVLNWFSIIGLITGCIGIIILVYGLFMFWYYSKIEKGLSSV